MHVLPDFRSAETTRHEGFYRVKWAYFHGESENFAREKEVGQVTGMAWDLCASNMHTEVASYNPGVYACTVYGEAALLFVSSNNPHGTHLKGTKYVCMLEDKESHEDALRNLGLNIGTDESVIHVNQYRAVLKYWAMEKDRNVTQSIYDTLQGESMIDLGLPLETPRATYLTAIKPDYTVGLMHGVGEGVRPQDVFPTPLQAKSFLGSLPEIQDETDRRTTLKVLNGRVYEVPFDVHADYIAMQWACTSTLEWLELNYPKGSEQLMEMLRKTLKITPA